MKTFTFALVALLIFSSVAAADRSAQHAKAGSTAECMGCDIETLLGLGQPQPKKVS
jgi:hypothetical protein